MELGKTLHVLDLFSGIGGFSLGLKHAGMRTVAFCEINPYCRAVLARHWPSVPIHHDIRQLAAGLLPTPPQVICGGFPCQDISTAGRGIGIAGTRSGLWSEFARLIGELRPRYAIVENVSALRSRGLHRVLGDLAALGYDAEWHCIPASAVGAPHRRDRIWIIAYANRDGQHDGPVNAEMASASQSMADANEAGFQEWKGQDARGAGPFCRPILERSEWWESEPDVGRVAYGVPSRVDRLKALGNAVVPQVVEIIGRAIKALDNAHGL